MASTGDVELRSHGYQVLRRPRKITNKDDEIDQTFSNNESMQCVRRLQMEWKIQKRKEINRGRIRGMVRLGCENDYEGHHFLTRLAKPLTKHDV